MKKILLASVFTLLITGCGNDNKATNLAGFPVSNSVDTYAQMDHDNLVRAYVDMNPEAAFMALYNAYIKEGSTDNHVGIMETSVDPRQKVLTANSETLYAVHPVNLADHDGAIILEVPPMTLGMVNSPGWNIVGDLGMTGADKGSGGTYVITGPTFKGEIPKGMYHISSDANTIVWLIRGFVKDNDWKGAVKHLKTLRTYTIAEIGNEPDTTFYNSSESIVNNGKNMDMSWDKSDTFGLIRQYVKDNGDTPHATRHAYTIGHLSDTGFFNGSLETAKLAVAVDAGEERVKTIAFNNRDKAAKKWGGVNHWEWANNVSDEFYTAKSTNIFLPSQQLAWTHKATFTAAGMTRPAEGTGSAYIEANKDSNGNFLDGGQCYTLTIPANMPAQNFWSVIAYDAVERSMVVNNDENWGANSFHKALKYNEDGAVTLTFGPQSSQGVKNHIQTNEGDGYFLWFRSYSPSASWYDNSWVLPNVEQVGCK